MDMEVLQVRERMRGGEGWREMKREEERGR
jgi:hypothetical protein